MVIREQIERFPGPRRFREAEAVSDSHTDAETHGRRRPTIQKAISGSLSIDHAKDAAAQTGRVQFRKNDRGAGPRRDDETQTASASRDKTSQSGGAETRPEICRQVAWRRAKRLSK